MPRPVSGDEVPLYKRRLFRVLVEERLKIHININHNAQCHFGTIVIPACPESFFGKDSRRASLAGMTNTCSYRYSVIRDCGNDK